MLFQDLRELKSELEIDLEDTSEDKRLNFLNTYASAWIEEYVNRPGLSYASRTEYYGGSGTQTLKLNSRPVYTTPGIQVFYDSNGFFGASSGAFTGENAQLTYGVDFALQIDQPNGTSRCGLLVNMKDYWQKPWVRQRGYLSPFPGKGFGNYKVIYTAGFTVDTLPEVFRTACLLLISRLRFIMPLAMELTGDSYEEKSISIVTAEKSKLLALIQPLLWSHKNRSF